MSKATITCPECDQTLSLLDKTQIKKYLAWNKKHKKCHNKSGAIGGSTTFSITPTGLGYIIKIKCNICNSKIDVTDYDW